MANSGSPDSGFSAIGEANLRDGNGPNYTATACRQVSAAASWLADDAAFTNVSDRYGLFATVCDCAVNTKVQVGHGGMSRVAGQTNKLASGNRLPRLNQYTALLQVVILSGRIIVVHDDDEICISTAASLPTTN